MGQITSATIKMIRDYAARGEHPPLTVHEIAQLATAWERGQPAASAGPRLWQPIDTAPKDNKRPLYLARFYEGELVELDFNGTWEYWQESWELPHINGYAWESNNGIEEPTHWSYQDEPLPVAAQAQPVVNQQLTTAARDVLAERRRQVEEEGWAAEHDDSHHTGEMALAAGCYAMYAHHPDYYGTGPRENRVPRMWPWAEKWWKQASPRRMLVKAGALILAEIERIDRAAARDVLAETECIDHARRIEGEAKP